MREILFRGKTPLCEWVYGNFIPDCLESVRGDKDLSWGFIKTYTQENEKEEIKTKTVEVQRETVGQFTGLTDKNGKKIFEGDIVQGTIVSAWNKSLIRCEVVYNKDGFIAVERTINQHWVHKVKFAKDIEVIGNIHDNPKLLGEQYGK